MSVTELKSQLHKAIDSITDEALLKQLHSLLQISAPGNGEEAWEQLPEAVKESLEASLRKADAGLVLSHEEVKKRFSQWLLK